MLDEALLEIPGTATVQLINSSWASHLQRVCARLKSIGLRHRDDGLQYLMRRLRHSRPSTYFHCLRVARLSHATGRAFGFNEEQVRQLSHTAMMHDIGKLLVPESILNRPRRPTRLEQFILHLHPNLGALLTSYFNLSPELRVRTQHHHERWDGRGYPHHLGGEDIPLMARIVQVVDTYDAMVERRPYREPLSHPDAVAELRRQGGSQFDPRVIEAFLDTFPKREV